MSLAWPAVVQLLVFIYSGTQQNCHEYPSLFIIVINLIFMFLLWCTDELGAFMRSEFLCISVLKVASGPRVKLAGSKNALNGPLVYSTDRSKAVVPVLVLFFVALWFILRSAFF